jgi:hypothetical protein
MGKHAETLEADWDAASEVVPSTPIELHTWVVTVKLDKNPEHDPQNKKTGKCPFSAHCTDVTGQHHSYLTSGYTEEEVRALWQQYHITRIERV